jgi:Transposase, Mutator family
MDKNSTTDAAPLFAGQAWFDPIEAELRERVRGFLEEMVEQEATAALGRSRYQRGAAAGYRNGTRARRLLGSFGPVEIAVPRARLSVADGTSREWRSAVLPRYARMTRQVEALIASAYLAGTNTRRVSGRSGRCSRAPSARAAGSHLQLQRPTGYLRECCSPFGTAPDRSADPPGPGPAANTGRGPAPRAPARSCLPSHSG